MRACACVRVCACMWYVQGLCGVCAYVCVWYVWEGTCVWDVCVCMCVWQLEFAAQML